MTQDTKLARHRAKQKKAGITRFSVQLDSDAVSLLRNLCQRHGKTQGEFLGLAIMAADSLLAGRLQVTKASAKPTASVIIRKPQERARVFDQAAGNTDMPQPSESAPTAPLHAPEQPADDIDARIRAAGAAWIMEP